MSKKYLYYFSEGNDAFGGDKVTMKNTLGGKGAGLAEMTAAGMPVPQGFTITTDACTQYYADGRQINDDITADIFEHLKGLEEITGKKFGDNTNPLLVSVRSGARQSMPGMMDTILNLGLNDEAVEGLAKKTGNARFAYDCYRRFVQMFADVVMMVPKSLFEVEIDKMKEAKGVKNDVDLTAEDLKELVGVFKKIYEENEGKPFPQDPLDQLIEGILGERLALVLLVDLLEDAHQFLQVLGSQVNVVLNALGFLHLVDLDLEQALRDHHNNVCKHLHETAVAVVCEAGVAGLLCQTFHSLIVQAQVQDGIHHAGHGLTGTGTDRDQQGVGVVAKLLAGDLFQTLEMLEDVSSDIVIDLTAVCIVLGAGIRGDGEALGNRHTGSSHLCQTGTLAAQSILHGDLVAAEGIVALAEVVQILFAHACLPPIW